MSNAEARAWWDDVQHLRPDAAPEPARRQSSTALRSVDDLPSAAELDAWLAAEAKEAAPRRFSRAGDDAAAEPAAPAVVAEPLERPAPRARRPRPERRPEPVDRDIDRDAGPSGEAGVEISLQRRPAAEPRSRATSGADGLLVARAAEAAAVAGPALRRAAREVSERRPRSPLDRTMSAPDRIALWAVILGVLLIVIAATTSSAQAAGF